MVKGDQAAIMLAWGPGRLHPFIGPSLLDHRLPRGCLHAKVLVGLLALPYAVLQPEECPCSCVSVPSHLAPWTSDCPFVGGEVGSPWGGRMSTSLVAAELGCSLPLRHFRTGGGLVVKLLPSM